jgi:hypothetical protein
MSETKQRTESWEVFEHSDHSGLEVGPLYHEPYFTGGQVNAVCTIHGLGGRNGVTEQNRAEARLISTAPDGLALAETVIQAKISCRLKGARHAGLPRTAEIDLDSWHLIVATASALKAKAEGNPA